MFIAPTNKINMRTLHSDIYIYTSPFKKLFHYAIFQKFFSHFLKKINGLSFTMHVIKLSCNFVSINHINV